MAYVGIIYDGPSRMIRRIVHPDRDIDLDYMRLSAGEIMVRMPRGAYDLKTQEDILRAFDLNG